MRPLRSTRDRTKEQAGTTAVPANAGRKCLRFRAQYLRLQSLLGPLRGTSKILLLVDQSCVACEAWIDSRLQFRTEALTEILPDFREVWLGGDVVELVRIHSQVLHDATDVLYQPDRDYCSW